MRITDQARPVRQALSALQSCACNSGIMSRQTWTVMKKKEKRKDHRDLGHHTLSFYILKFKI